MPNVRHLNKEKYKMSKQRFREIYYFCLQYNEWREELKQNTNTVGAICSDGLPHGSNTSDSTGELAIRRAELVRKCELIEQTVIEADARLYPYILKAVTTENITFNYLERVMKIPCGRDLYYDKRRKFYWLISQKI